MNSRQIIFACIFLLASQIQARQFHDLFPTPRGLSMGGAISAYTDDYDSIYYNPAGLANYEGWNIRAPDLLQLGLSTGIKSIYEEIQDLDTSNSSSIASQLSGLDGKTGSAQLQLMGLGFFMNRFAVMLNPFSLNAALRVRTPSTLFSKVDARVTYDAGLSSAYAHSFFENKLRVGVALRFLARAGVDDEIEGTSLLGLSSADDFAELGGAGVGMDMDIGVQGNTDPVTVGPFKVTPMGGLVFQNLLATKYTMLRIMEDRFSGLPPRLQRRINMGAAAKVEGVGPFYAIPSLEFRDLLISTDSFWEYVSTGIEFGLKPRTWFQGFIRTAYSKGNFVAGLGGKLGPGELELGTHAVALGDGFGVGKDRRFYLKLATTW